MPRPKSSCWALAFLAAMILAMPVRSAAIGGVLYLLNSNSTYQQGCFAPCLCPVSAPEEMTGSFALERLRPSPSFDRYRVSRVSWIVMDPNGQRTHSVRGHGIYQLGGEATLMQQLILDLSVDGAAPEIFDSGLVPAESLFPDISVAIDLGAACYDIRMEVSADRD